MAGGRIITWVAALLGALLLSAPARAEVPLPVCLARVQPGDTPARMLRQPARFDCRANQHSLGAGDYWALSMPLPRSGVPHHPRIRLASVWQRALTLHAIYADRRVATIATDRRSLSRHLQLGAVVEFRLPIRAAPLDRLLFRVDGAGNARGVLLDLRLSDAGSSAAANTLLAAVYAGFGGLAVALLLYNLALWAAMRHRFQLVYCAMVLALVVYAFSTSGALAWAWPDVDQLWRIRLNYIVLGCALAAALHFARTFFDARIFTPLVDRLMAVATLLAGSSGGVFALFAGTDMARADLVYSCMFVASLAAVPPLLLGAWRRERTFFWLFAIAWAGPLAFAGARVLAALHVIPSSFWLDNSTVLAMGAEALLSNLAIAYRVHLLGRERDEARAREAAAQLLADADPLTGLANRRAFLSAAIGRAGPQVLHIVDIDHFKQVNETLGHDGGDEVLRRFARELRAAAPRGSLVARFGGEEFALVTDAAQPLDVEALLARFRAARMPFDLTVTASLGACEGPLGDEGDWKRLYRDADRALYEAKAAGRDRARRAVAHRMPLAA